MPRLFHLARARYIAARGIELTLHQRVGEMNDGDVAALHLQAARGFEAQQSAADDDSLAARARPSRAAPACHPECGRRKTFFLSTPGMGGMKALLPVARMSLSYGVTPPSSPVTVCASRIDVGDADAEPGLDAVGSIPVDVVKHDLVGGLLAGEHRRKHDAVVVDVRLVAEDRDLEIRAGTSGSARRRRRRPCRCRPRRVAVFIALAPACVRRARRIACSSARAKSGRRRFA